LIPSRINLVVDSKHASKLQERKKGRHGLIGCDYLG